MPDRDKRELVEQLGTFPTLKGCTKDDLEALADAGGPAALPAGWPFVTQGEPADACYFLLTGSARVFLHRKEIAQLGPGDIIGEMAFLGGGQRGATVTSSERVTAHRVENDALREPVEKHPNVRKALESVYNAHTSSTAQATGD
ncbi:MAG TPA: cyclic nucleotide-binding domain-containing protein [Jatrophihabitantaceae bacterium]|nr:cyclic nucleotide-binding domain-containing protein [Jatrophihabitantaceae bacterium]